MDLNEMKLDSVVLMNFVLIGKKLIYGMPSPLQYLILYYRQQPRMLSLGTKSVNLSSHCMSSENKRNMHIYMLNVDKVAYLLHIRVK